MPRVCTICSHPQRAAINRALVEGEAFRSIAERFGTSATALARHKKDHMPVAIARAQEAAQVADADDLLGQLHVLRSRALAILDQAEKAGELRTALAAIREARGVIELLLEVEGELDRRASVNVLVSPDWLLVRSAILAALRAFPDAREAVARELAVIEEGPSHADR